MRERLVHTFLARLAEDVVRIVADVATDHNRVAFEKLPRIRQVLKAQDKVEGAIQSFLDLRHRTIGDAGWQWVTDALAEPEFAAVQVPYVDNLSDNGAEP